MDTARQAPSHHTGASSPAHVPVEGWDAVAVESERLRVRRRARLRRMVALGLVVVLSIGFSQLFLRSGGGSGWRVGARSEEQLVFHLATTLVYGGAFGCMQRWSGSRSASPLALLVAVVTAGLIAAGVWGAVTAALATERDPGQPASWWRSNPGARAPAVGSELVAALRPGLLILLVAVLPLVLSVWDAVLTRRERRHLQDLEDGIALRGRVPASRGDATTGVSERSDPDGGTPGRSGDLLPPGPRTGPAAARWSPRKTAHAGRRHEQLLLQEEGRRRRSAGTRFRAVLWTVLAVHLGVYISALPHRQVRWQPSLSSTVYSLAVLISAAAAYLLMHGWARSRHASTRRFLGALLTAVAVAAAGWWTTCAALAGVSLIPEGLDHLKDPEVMATYESLLAAPVITAHGSWQQAALVACGVLVPVLLAVWDARSDRSDREHLRGLRHGAAAQHGYREPESGPTVVGETPAPPTGPPGDPSPRDRWADAR